jgi:hypothetical protein
MSRLAYPLEEELDIIRKWDVIHGSMRELAEYVQTIWTWKDFARIENNHLILITGGWSGNEEIVGAMLENRMIKSIYYYQWTRGGKYIFELGD